MAVPIKHFATYEDSTHPGVQRWWKNIPRNHPFAQHPILGKHGHDLSKGGYEYTSGRTGLPQIDPAYVQRYGQKLFQKIIQLEQAHATELEELAKDIVSKFWGIDKSQLDADLTPNIEEPQPKPKVKPSPMTPELQEQVNKRITMNTMQQGASVHGMLTMHYLAEKEIQAMSPELIKLYSDIAGGAVQQYWHLDIPTIAAMLEQMLKQMGNLQGAGNIVGGREWVEFKEEGQPPVVKAQALCFPFLCQELNKGVMELLTMDSLADLKEADLATVLETADRKWDEPWYILVGPELWRRFLKVIPNDVKLSDIVYAFAKKPPKEVHAILEHVIRNPQQAKPLLAALIQQEEAPPVEFEAPAQFNEAPPQDDFPDVPGDDLQY